MRKVALDIGGRKIAACEVADGQVVHRSTVSGLHLLEFLLGPEQPPARVAIEACAEAWAIQTQLDKWGNETVLIDTTRVRQLGVGQHGRKTDRLDAEALARALDRGGIPVAHLLSPHRRELRFALAVRRALVEARAKYIMTARALARAYGQRLPACDVDWFVRRVRGAHLDQALYDVIGPLVAVVEVMQKQLITAEDRIAELCKLEPAIALLTTVPGVGAIVAASFVSVIDEAGRFNDAHQVSAYLGLVPQENSSGQRRRLGAITKQGNSYVRALLVEAANTLLGPAGRDDPLAQWARAVSRRRTRRIAAIALARRLAGILWAMWRHGNAYDPKLLGAASGRGLKSYAQTIEFRAAALKRAAAKVQYRRARRGKGSGDGPTSHAPDANPAGAVSPGGQEQARQGSSAEPTLDSPARRRRTATTTRSAGFVSR